ncbi:MAG: 2-C-methyl-D-erythritol 2,4-cyclodiphosphate synthase [Alphaproteobacteria bacterium]|jgi:2-C-methyl-D-erythritol 4-phosphate cytidylyltransferase/2-C-methyl-D-erythritol 2,4-cyclodiphosphate synthase|nr:2-C-methyl-D-erythritol 2,4-cyclodiphosphate synthase [Alphaproteobacteria bacterium]
MMKKNSTVLILLAAGKSTRFSDSIPKQYVHINGKTLLENALSPCINNPNIDYILPVIAQEHLEIYNNLKLSHEKLLPPVFGGSHRGASVLNALEALRELAPNKVLIHDCARTFTPQHLFDEVIANITPSQGVIPALPIVDTLKLAENSIVVNEISRDNLFAVQTPQGFIYEEIYDSYKKFQNEVLTDDSSYYIKNGFSVKIIKGDDLAKKITYEADLKIMYETRVGLGQDIHQFDSLRQEIYLCGVKIPHSKGLKAHSDGDVVLHALVDALLGALALGDIGDYFPPGEAKWKNQPSKTFLEFAYSKMLELQGRFINIDITILAEEPKISPHKTAMRQFLADTLNIAENRINIKATTMEKLGAVGRGEGIFASAAVSIEIPRNN